MSAGENDDNDIWQYGEDDPVSPFSDFMNLGQASVSRVIGSLRSALTTLQTTVTALGKRVNVNHVLMSWAATGGVGTNYQPVTGQAPIMRFGHTSDDTDAGGRLTTTFPVPFTGGIAGVIILPHNNSNFAAYPVLVEGSVTKNGFQTFWGSRGSAGVDLPYVAIGWDKP